MYRTAIGVLAATIGCSGDDGGGGSGRLDPEKVVRACAILNACGSESDLHNCVYNIDRNAAVLVNCVLAATAADCNAANACIGVKRTPDANCVAGCLDGDTVVQCNEPGIRTEIDCTLHIDSGGPSCITGPSASACGTSTCSTEGEATCNGTVRNLCGAGILRSFDCGRLGQECVPQSPGCLPPVVGTCTTGVSSCDGDDLIVCDLDGTSRRFDCSVYPGMTCELYQSPGSMSVTCAYDRTCQSGNAVCIGNTLHACLGDAEWDIDCTSIGATTCRDTFTGAQCGL
jgi:hypothetical protein